MSYSVVHQKQSIGQSASVDVAFVLTLDFGTRVVPNGPDLAIERLCPSTRQWLAVMHISNALVLSQHNSKEEADRALAVVREMMEIHDS